jgi:hypothetical protein
MRDMGSSSYPFRACEDLVLLSRSSASYHPLPLGEGRGEGLRDNNALPLTMLLLTLSHWERAGVRAYTV